MHCIDVYNLYYASINNFTSQRDYESEFTRIYVGFDYLCQYVYSIHSITQEMVKCISNVQNS